MRNFTLIVLAFCFLASCKKSNTQNFQPALISGSVFDLSNQVGIPNVLVRAYWVKGFSEQIAIDSTFTDAQGNYSMNSSIDVTRFDQGQTLDVVAMTPNGFISPIDLEHPSVGATTIGYSRIMSMPRFDFYRQANLTINAQQSLNDAFTEIAFYYRYGGRGYWLNVTNNHPAGSLTYQVKTAIGIPTEVYWTKKLTSGNTTTSSATVSALPNTSNTVTIQY